VRFAVDWTKEAVSRNGRNGHQGRNKGKRWLEGAGKTPLSYKMLKKNLLEIRRIWIKPLRGTAIPHHRLQQPSIEKNFFREKDLKPKKMNFFEKSACGGSGFP
jgi:hypothetical protein